MHVLRFLKRYNKLLNVHARFLIFLGLLWRLCGAKVNH
jgi:hypothetical protein